MKAFLRDMAAEWRAVPLWFWLLVSSFILLGIPLLEWAVAGVPLPSGQRLLRMCLALFLGGLTGLTLMTMTRRWKRVRTEKGGQ